MAKPTTQADELQPHNIEAEEAVLGSLLIDPDAILRVASFLDYKDFFVERNGWIYAAIRDLHDRHEPSDLVTLSDELERRNKLYEIGGPAHLTNLINATPTSVHAEHYGRIIERTALLRRLIGAASQIAVMAYEDQSDADKIADRAEEVLRLARGKSRNGGLKHFGTMLIDQCDRVDYIRTNGAPSGLMTGLIDLDKILRGLKGGNVVIMAGRPGTGKSSLAATVAVNAAKMGHKVGIFTLEMSQDELCRRILSMESDLDSYKITDGDMSNEEAMLVEKTASELSELPIFIDDSPAITLGYLRSQAMKLHAEVGLDLLVIDYLQLMTGAKGANRQAEIGEISRGIKQLAKELNIPIIPCAQLSREVERRMDKRPILSDLRESGDIEQDADIVLFIYRDELYNKDTEFPNQAELIIAKHRDGATGKVDVFFKKHTTKFTDLEIKLNELDY